MTAERRRTRVIYAGRVQGVGFRFTARNLARQFPVRGYVRNLRDGTVELVADGAADSVKNFLAAIATAMTGYIDSADEREAPADEIFETFEIRM